ncbi:MAG: GGDEF domain-containing protein [Sphingomonadales bacterium]|nr:GGDEF domain-containing protein [Sphingomonadales bacterium]
MSVNNQTAVTETEDIGVEPQKRMSMVNTLLVACAIGMFVYIGGSVATQMVRQYAGTAPGTDQAMVSALLLNIALILLIWRRTTALSSEVDIYKQAEVRAKHLAITDPLTNLFNRRAIKEKTAELSTRSSRRGKSIAFLMIDLDGFKKINDLYGHDSGDQLLREVADRMRDTAPPSSILARLGGDELASAWFSNLNFRKRLTALPKI